MLVEAEQLCRQAIIILEKSLGKEHPNYASTLNNIAELLGSQVRSKSMHIVKTHC